MKRSKELDLAALLVQMELTERAKPSMLVHDSSKTTGRDATTECTDLFALAMDMPKFPLLKKRK